jgi:signal transduction histidine kinase/ActR/RegA family two-component response regulator
MKMRDATPPAASQPTAAPPPRGQLFRKYVGLFITVVCAALVTNGLLEIWFSYREQNVLLTRVQQEQARSAAAKISQYIKEIEGQLAWATLLPWSTDTLDEWKMDAARMLRLAPAVTEVAQVDAAGREQIFTSRLVKDVVGSGIDYSQKDFFVKAVANKVYYGPVHFLRESEPYMTLAMAGVRSDYGVILAQVNLKHIWDLVSQIQVGVSGRAYVVDPAGRLIAHPDISMVLRNTDMSRLAQVRAAQADGSAPPSGQPLVTNDIEGRPVLSVHAPVEPLGWLVLVELPVDEAYAPLYSSIQRSVALLVGALALAALAGLYLARRMMTPIRALHDGAVRIGRGDLDERISIKTGDELEALGEQFNRMATQLQDSYASLEHKVEERTYQLELANSAKSRFLAVASHDLRQPLHALGLFVAQLRIAATDAERQRLVERIDAAAAMMNELFKALLDISRLDAGALTPKITEFPVTKLFARVQTTFAGTAKDAGLDFRVIPTDAWVRSDFVLLEQILLNLVSNAVRYVARGGVLIGARKRGRDLRIEVWDTGPGIPDDQRQKIFSEFYRGADPQHDRRGLGGGLGLGLAIVDRMCRLLHHPIELSSDVGHGSRFSVIVPIVAAAAHAAEPPTPAFSALNIATEKLIVVIDDDALALEGMGGLLRSWGCRVVAARSAAEALLGLTDAECPPDLVISDFHLSDQSTGIDAIEQLRAGFGVPIPAFLVSGDISPALLQQAKHGGYHLLHKPVDPMPLRTMLNRLLKKRGVAEAGRSTV